MGQAGSSNPQQAPPNTENQNVGPAWWCKIGSKGVGVIAGLSAMIIGVINCFSLSGICIASAVLLMVIGFVLIMMEAPCCCPFIDFIQPLGRWSDNRPHIQKAVLYGVITRSFCSNLSYAEIRWFTVSLSIIIFSCFAIVPVALCFTLTKLLAGAFIMVTAAFYGLMALGKKADRTEMAVKARGGGDTEMKATLLTNQDVEADPK